jgi:hypothetical protein
MVDYERSRRLRDRYGAPTGACFATCRDIVLHHGEDETLWYIEGFVLLPDNTRIEHAWIAGEGDRLYDSTLCDDDMVGFSRYTSENRQQTKPDRKCPKPMSAHNLSNHMEEDLPEDPRILHSPMGLFYPANQIDTGKSIQMESSNFGKLAGWLSDRASEFISATLRTYLISHSQIFGLASGGAS